MSAVCIIQARMGSTRLPGKVLRTIGAYPAIYHVYQRAKLGCPNTVVAIPAGPTDDPLAAYLACQDIPVFRWDGPAADVLGRYAACVRRHPADIVVRVTGDCPFLDPTLVAEAISRVTELAYVSNTRQRTYPRGLDVEAFDLRLLELADAIAVQPGYREHVTPMIHLLARTETQLLGPRDLSAYRWTLDTPQDLRWFRAIADCVPTRPPDPTSQTLLALLAEHPFLRHYDAPAVYR